MGVYVVPWFRQWMAKQDVGDQDLCRAVLEMSRGLIDAALGGGLFKKRIARPGGGKRGGYRTLVATRHAGQWFFLHGFAKNERENIEISQVRLFKQMANDLLTSTAEQLRERILNNELCEVNCGERI